VYRNRLATYEGATGFILDWMVTGFFPNAVGGGRAPNLFDPKKSRFWTKDYLQAVGGEAGVRRIPKARRIAPVEWLAVHAPRYHPKLFLNSFRRAYPQLDAAWPDPWDHLWYALAVIESDTAQEAEVRLCAHDGCRLWWNGRLEFQEHSWHKLVFDLNTVPVRLRKGRNSLLLKLDRFGLVARLTAPGGGRLKGGIRCVSAAQPRREPPGTFEQLTRYSRTLKVALPCRARTPEELGRWKRAARAHFRKAIGPFPAVSRSRARLVSRPELLARAGFLTATWAERALSHDRLDPTGVRTGDACNLAGLCAQAMSMTLPGLHLFDLHGVTDFVCLLDGVSKRRLGLMGLSGGATMTYLAGAYDDRFRAMGVFCGIHSYADYARSYDGCAQQVVPNLYPTLDVGELLCLAAPRPLLLAQGRRDVTFNVFLLKRFARQARRAYRTLGAADRLELHLYDLAHQVDIGAAIDFFLRRL